MLWRMFWERWGGEASMGDGEILGAWHLFGARERVASNFE